ncbi:MAG: hypothetical protein AAB389_04585 [Patescibacteria group bacterium]
MADEKIAGLEAALEAEKKDCAFEKKRVTGFFVTTLICGLAAILGWGTFYHRGIDLRATEQKLAEETEKSKRLLEFGERMKNVAQELYLKAGGEVKRSRWDAGENKFVDAPLRAKPESLRKISNSISISGIPAMTLVLEDRHFDILMRDPANIQPLLDQSARYELIRVPLGKSEQQLYFLFKDGQVCADGMGDDTDMKIHLGEIFIAVLEEIVSGKIEEIQKPREMIELPDPTPQEPNSDGEAEYNFTPQIKMAFFENMSQEDTQKMLKVLNEQKRQYQAELNKLYRKNLELEKKLK